MFTINNFKVIQFHAKAPLLKPWGDFGPAHAVESLSVNLVFLIK